MRRLLILAALFGVWANTPGFAQIRSDPGNVGPRAVTRSPGDTSSPNAAATGSTPSGQARNNGAAAVPNAIPADQARAMIQGKCAGPVADLSLDDHSTWHAKCHNEGRDHAVTLGSDGNVQIR